MKRSQLLGKHRGEEAARRTRLEAQIRARLLHDNIVPLDDFGVAERALRQRALRPQIEKVWDDVSTTVLRQPSARVRLNREMARAVPKQLAAELDQEIFRLADESDVELAQAVTPPDEVRGARLVRLLAGSGSTCTSRRAAASPGASASLRC